MIRRRPWRPAENNDLNNDLPPAGEADGKTINDFINDVINDLPQAGEAGGKTINDFLNEIINDSPPAGEAGGKKGSQFFKIRSFQIYYCYNNNNNRPAYFQYY